MTGHAAAVESPRESIAATFTLPRSLPPTIGVGAFLKNTVAVLHGDRAYVSPDLGNLDSVEAIRRFEDVARSLPGAAGCEPEIAAHDMHPDFASTRYAQALGLPTAEIQHHHAHVAAVMAEHGLQEPVLGLALDGFGLGPDQESWGGELLRVDASGYRRIGHLRLLHQPGGDVAARQPWRMGAAALHALGRTSEITTLFADHQGAGIVAQMLDRSLNAPPTSSCGRLFDAACGLLGVIPVARFEGEAPMALEAMVGRTSVLDGGWRTGDDGVLDLLPLLDRLPGMAAADGADMFHGTLIAALAGWAKWGEARTGIGTIVLSGGCMLNRVLRSGLTDALSGLELQPLSSIVLTPGDGAISLGQAYAAALAIEGG